MGGRGSGRYTRWNSQTTLEECLKLDVRWMQREGYLRAGSAGSLTWSWDGEPAGNIRYVSYGDSVSLIYKTRNCSDEEWTDRSHDVSLTWTHPHIGGRRPWWLCPYCYRRAAILYSLTGEFACRQCMRLPYASQGESDYDRANRKARKKWDRLDEDGERPKGMHQTTYDRLLREADNAEYQANCFLVWRLGDLGLLDDLIETDAP